MRSIKTAFVFLIRNVISSDGGVQIGRDGECKKSGADSKDAEEPDWSGWSLGSSKGMMWDVDLGRLFMWTAYG